MFRLWCLLQVLFAAAFLFAGEANAGGAVKAAFDGDNIDLVDALDVVESEKPRVEIEVPGIDATGRSRLVLEARTPRSHYRWAVFSLINPDKTERVLVLDIPDHGFVGSGVLLPKPPSGRTIAVNLSNGNHPIALKVRAHQSFEFSVGPGKHLSVSMELAPGIIDEVRLWNKVAFDTQIANNALFDGVIIGVSLLVAVAIFTLAIVKKQIVFFAVGTFALSAIGFLMLNAGFVPVIGEWIAGVEQYEMLGRAIVETLMFVSISVSLIFLTQLYRHMPLVNGFLMLLAMLGVGLLAFSFYQPIFSTGMSRIGFFIVVVLGLLIIGLLQKRSVVRAKTVFASWFVLAVWAFLAMAGCLGIYKLALLGPLIAAGLALVLVTFGFTLAKFAFSHGISASFFMEDAGRRALALAGSEQSVWDWQAVEESLHVGPELERALGLKTGSVGGVDLRNWLEIIHPADRSVYVGAVEAAERRGSGTFSAEFRLRRADGAYRWYLLRARAIAGEGNRAERLIGTLTDITTVKHSEDRLLSDAVRDRVTGLPNRALFIDRLERAMRRAEARNDDSLHVLVIDLDRFKAVNDGLGHQTGDSLLNIMGKRLKRLIAESDTLARLNGDQFGIIFNARANGLEIVEFAENLRDVLAQPVNMRPREIFLTASVGIAKFEIGRDLPEDVVKNAEIALYESKRNGTDQIAFFNADMRDDRSQLVTLENEMRRAIERNEIEVVYQPLMRLADGELAGFEALMRWNHPERGRIGPDEFIEIAEESGIIRELGHYVLSEAACQLGIWQRAFRPSDPLFVAVNVSSAQLLSNELPNELQQILLREAIIPGSLKVELTETMVMQNPELSEKILKKIASLGIGLSCDDFGTGYSSLANLRKLPFDTLKIDREFLADDANDQRVHIIFDAITRLAHDLNFSVVSEGVESEEHLERLRQAGCDYAQGFYIGEPVSATRVVEALGGLPYTPVSKTSVMAELWERLVGKDEKAEAPVAGPVSRVEVATDIEPIELDEPEEEPLVPWSPDDAQQVEYPAFEPVDELREAVEETQQEVTPAVGSVPLAPRIVVKPPVEDEATNSGQPSTGDDEVIAEIADNIEKLTEDTADAKPVARHVRTMRIKKQRKRAKVNSRNLKLRRARSRRKAG